MAIIRAFLVENFEGADNFRRVVHNNQGALADYEGVAGKSTLKGDGWSMRIELGVVALAAKGHSSLGWWRVVAQRGRSAMIDTIKGWLSIGRRVWKTGHQPGPTPFELNLKNELEVEQLRFANEWLFPWHNINIPNRVVNVDDFQGRRISVGGVRFEGQLQLIYWQAIRRYFALKSHDAFRAWDVAALLGLEVEQS